MGDLPVPRTTEQQFFAGICSRLDRQNTLLEDIRDRLPVPVEQPVAATAGVPRTVELIEPAQPGKATSARKPAPRKRAARTAASTRES